MIRTVRYNENTDVIELLEDDGPGGRILIVGRWAGYRAFADDDQDYTLIVWIVRGTPIDRVAQRFASCGMTRLP
jgi:hypothetical protein